LAQVLAAWSELWAKVSVIEGREPMRTAFFALLSGVVFMLAPSPAWAAEVLITEAEASLPADPVAPARGLTRGPQVAQLMPNPGAGIVVTSPLALKIKFQARNNVPVDKDSVKLTYLRKPNVDLTGRVKKHVGDDGIDIGQAQVPPGDHLIRIELKDQQGRSSTGIIKLSVVN
jgi:hypothetical protein